MQDGLVLEEVQMPPRPLLGVVDLAPWVPALRAGEAAAAREVEPQVELLIVLAELDSGDCPRRG